jgi:multimeric flavodoxin WrbA
MAFNGSPRKKKWNTVTLLGKALEGAQSAGAETELVQLYDLNFSGCISCFSCKKMDRKENGVCAVRDDLSPVLQRIRAATALIIGTPVYLGAESASTRAFLERLVFPFINYSDYRRSFFPGRIQTALIYTMNVPEELLEQFGYPRMFETTTRMLKRNFGECELLLSTDTLQFENYDRYEAKNFNPEAKAKRHAEVFPEDCKKAFELGVRLASGGSSDREQA